MKLEKVMPDSDSVTGSLGKFVPKGWGYEYWIANNKKYCMKLLYLKQGKGCSWHFHKKKDEVFYVQQGKLTIRYHEEDCLTEEAQHKLKKNKKYKIKMEDIDLARTRWCSLAAGQSFHVPPGIRHTFSTWDSGDCTFFEVSTTHYEEDSYRIAKGD